MRINHFVCDCCGKEVTYKINKTAKSTYKSEQCHHIDLGVAGEGSQLNGAEVAFDLCDSCLTGFINTFKHKDSILHSGSRVEMFEEYGKALAEEYGYVNQED